MLLVIKIDLFAIEVLMILFRLFLLQRTVLTLLLRKHPALKQCQPLLQQKVQQYLKQSLPL